EFFDRVAHAFRFAGGFSLGLDPKPGFPARGLANIFHASSQFSPATSSNRAPSWQVRHYRCNATNRQDQGHDPSRQMEQQSARRGASATAGRPNGRAAPLQQELVLSNPATARSAQP